MIDAAILKQLNDTDPEYRKQAVMELAKTKNREALNYLASVYRTDKDAEVRELARKAGVFINKHTGGSTSKRKNDGLFTLDDEDDDYSSSRGTYYEEAEPHEEPVTVQVSELDKERAMGLVKQALDVHMRGNNERALKYLRDAYKKNPNLRRDTYTSSLATTITGLPPDEAFRMLTDDGSNTGKKKKRSSSSVKDEPTWGDATVDLIIYMLVNMALVALGVLGFVWLLMPAFSQALAAQSNLAASQGLSSALDPAAIINLLTGIGVGLILLYSAIAGFVSMIILLIQDFFIHMVSVSVLGGEGTMARLITKTTIPLAFVYPLYYLANFGLTLYAASDPRVYGTVSVIQLAMSIGFSIWFASRIGVAYRFGTSKGCAAIILAGIAMVAVACVCSLILPYVMASSVNAMGY
jgi:tetratricopeptide (TPR) repeat protein